MEQIIKISINTFLDWRNLYMIKVQAENIKNKNQVKSILDSLKPINKYIDTLDEDDSRYEYLCEKVEEVYLEIDEALIGCEEFSEENIANATIRIMIYWDYIKGNISWDKFVSEIKKCSSKKLLINLD